MSFGINGISFLNMKVRGNNLLLSDSVFIEMLSSYRPNHRVSLLDSCLFIYYLLSSFFNQLKSGYFNCHLLISLRNQPIS
jgi:hypothetical protein